MDSIENYRIKLEEIADYAFSHGLNAIGIEQFKSGPPDTWDKEILDKFYIACHDGFKIAQKLIIEEIQKYQILLRDTTAELKEYRRQRNKEKEKETLSKIKIIERRLHNFSHMADGIAWQMLGGQIHLARRFHIQEKSSKFLDSSNLSHAIAVADELNKNPNDFALLSDLTSFIQIGDLLVRHGKITAVMELKEGKVNDLIRDFLNSVEKEGKDITDEELKEKFDENTVKQIKRVQRQQERANRAIDVMNNDEGIDPVSGKNIFVGTPSIQTKFYHEELRKLYEDLQNKIWAYTVVDTCVHIGVYRDEGLAMAPFTIPHILKQQTENFIVVDWVSITENLSEPIFGKPFPPEFIVDILTGKVKVVIGINVDALIETFNVFGLETRWLTEKETAKRKQASVREGMIIVNKKGIAIILPGTQEVTLYGGTFSKIIYDTIKPSNIALSYLYSDIKYDEKGQKEANNIEPKED
jgi:hypothetical protein